MYLNSKSKAKSRLTEIRKEAGLTQAQLAVLVGVTTNTIQNWEKPNGLAQLEKYLKLGEIFGLKNLEELFEHVEISEEEQQKSKGISLEELRQIRKSWGTEVTAKTSYSIKTQSNSKLSNEDTK